MPNKNRSWTSFMKEFHEKFDLPIAAKSDISEVIMQRRRPIVEEYGEFTDALLQLLAAYDAKDAFPDRAEALKDITTKYRENVLKEGNDLIYTVISLFVALGMNTDEGFRRVHMSNMDKVWPDGKVHKNEHGKVLKPEGYKQPSLADLV